MPDPGAPGRTMRALVKYGNADGEVEIREVPVPDIGDGDVLLETKAVGICGWDLEMWRHRMANPVTVPVVQGHEFCGVVVRAGKDVVGFAEGDRVVCETSAEVCGVCPSCRTGDYQLCARRKGFGYGVDGAFADYVKVRRDCLHHLPDTVDFDHACLAEPACVAYQALAVLSRILPGMPVAVLGPGPIGLMSLQMAKACGAGTVYVVATGRSPKRIAAARTLGAVVLDASREDPLERILADTGREGVPLVVDAAGNGATLALSLKLVARRGQITKVGWGPEPAGVSLDPLLSKSASLQGSFSHNWPCWEAVVALLAQGRLDMETMISHRIGLDRWRETFEALERGDGIKGVVRFNR